MAGLRDYSTTAAANTALFPEGMAPSAVNDGMRQVQADIRAWYEDADWIDLGDTPAYASVTTFTVAGDRTGPYQVGRRVRAVGTAPFTIYGSIIGASFAADTTVTVAWDSGGLDNTLTRVAVGIVSAATPGAPRASASVSGIVELADAGEVAAGLDDGRAATPAGLSAAVAFQGRQTIWVPANAMTPRLTDGASQGMTETETHKVIRRTLDFAADAADFAQFTVAMPKSWDRAAVSAEFLWTAETGSGAVVWALQGLALSDDDATDAGFGSAQIAADTLIAAGDLHRSAETAGITVAGAPAEGDLVVFQTYRAAADVGDTLDAPAKLVGLRLFYSTNARNDA